MERIVKKIEEPYLKTGLSVLEPGDTVKVITKVVEGDKSRFQTFEGVIISIQGEGLGKTVKVRKISYGVGVERTFPIHSPNVDSFEIVKKGSPRRAKLFYLRDRVGKRALKVKASKNKVEYEELMIIPDEAAESMEEATVNTGTTDQPVDTSPATETTEATTEAKERAGESKEEPNKRRRSNP